MNGIFITGAGGFIGRAVATHFHLSSRTASCHIGIEPKDYHMRPSGDNLYYGEFPSYDLCLLMFQKHDVVIHLAGPRPQAHYSDEEQVLQTHLESCETVIKACAATGVKRLVYLSTAEVYKPSQQKHVESDPLEPITAFGRIKLAAEKLLSRLAKVFGVELVILRAFSLIGPHPTGQSLFKEVLSQAMDNSEIQLQKWWLERDYLHLHDLARAIEKATSAELPEPVVCYNIASGEGCQLKEMAEVMVRVMKREMPDMEDAVIPVIIPEQETPREYEDGDVLLADVTAISRDLKWHLMGDLDQAIDLALVWYVDVEYLEDQWEDELEQ